MSLKLVAPIHISHRQMNADASHSFEGIDTTPENSEIRIKIWDAREKIWFDYLVDGQSLKADPPHALTVQFASSENGQWVLREIRFNSQQDYEGFLCEFAESKQNSVQGK